MVWLGDSTLLQGKARVTYPDLVAPRLGRQGVESRVVATPGLDSYGFYFLMDAVLAWRPVAVALVAHLRPSATRTPAPTMPTSRPAGHFNAAGAARMADLVAPAI